MVFNDPLLFNPWSGVAGNPLFLIYFSRYHNCFVLVSHQHLHPTYGPDMAEDPTKRCFVICPIGDPGSPERAWSDDILHNLIEPIAQIWLQRSACD